MGRRESRKRKLAAAMAVAGCLAFGGMQSVWADTTKGNVGGTGDNQDVYSLGEVTVEAKRPDWESKLSPGTVTVIRPADYKGEQKDLADFLKMVPGVHVREVNGKGQYTTVSIRGSTAAQVGVFVDGILFNLGGDAAVDISTIPVRNVERIEVYRGYIPARFGGTYMGGVVNIVTKKPTKENVTASIGQKSYGGYVGSVEVDAPLGNGSFMIGVNRDQSEGDFKYKNVRSDNEKAVWQGQLDHYQSTIDNFTLKSIAKAAKYGYIGKDQAPGFLNDTVTWEKYRTEITANGKTGLYNDDYQRYYNNLPASYSTGMAMITDYYKLSDEEQYQMYQDWKNGNKQKYAELYADSWCRHIAEYLDPDKSMEVTQAKEIVKKYKKLVKDLGNGNRWRRYNDYKNTDVIAKWQNEHWTVKAGWKQILRHLPRATVNGIAPDPFIDTDSLYYGMAKSRQNLIDKEALVAWRNHAGRLEWGWSTDFLDQNKKYRCENWEILEALNPNDVYAKVPFRKWSTYNSMKWNGSLDGSYHAGDRHLLEFMMNYSHETMKVRGSGVTEDLLTGFEYYNRYRTYYTQQLFNIQLQDTITLDQKNTWWLTPSIRYNQSQVHSGPTMAYQHAKDEGLPTGMYKPITQRDGKATWQIALKKQVNDRLTLRTTGGTYYRLLNLYEIAGDGGGIMPAPLRQGNHYTYNFAKPESGKQFDVSAIWDGPILGAKKSSIQLTYFYRNSINMLQLNRWGLDYWSYTNDLRGSSRGLELQTDISWKKWDLSMGGTYLHTKGVESTPQAIVSGYVAPYPVNQTYTPDWEGYARMAYHPNGSVTLFGQVNYTGRLYTQIYSHQTSQCEYEQDALTTIGAGIKYKRDNGLQLTLGCNDIFNKGPQLMQRQVRCKWDPSLGVPISYNPDYPIQGRTWYATIQYDF